MAVKQEPYIQPKDSNDAEADTLVLSGQKSRPSQITFQFPSHHGFKWPGKDAHLVSPEQARDLRLILTALALNNHPAFLPHSRHPGRSDLPEIENGGNAAPERERVKINFVDGKGKPEVKKSESGETLTVNIYNNPSNVQHNTQNNGQAGSLLNTLTSLTPWGMAKVLGGTSIAVLGTYYLGPTVLNYAKNKLAGMVLPENLMARTTEFFSTPLSWFRNGTGSAAATAAATVAETATETLAATATQTATNVATPTITQAATETLAHNGTTQILPTILQGDVPLSAVTGGVMDSISDGLSNAASVVGNVAARGLNLGFSFLNSPASMFVFPFFYNYARSRGAKGRAHDIHYHVTPPIYQETGRATGQVKGFKGNVHGFRSS